MTTQAEAGSGAADTQQTGNLAGQQQSSDNGSAGGAAKSWLDGLSEGNRKLADTKGWKEPGDLDKALTSYAELEALQGKSLRIPGADATADELNEFYSKLGRPESPDKYEFKRPENLPADLPYSDDLAKASKSWMHEAGLNSKQAQAMHDHFVTFQAEQAKAAQATYATAVESTHDALVKEWGPLDSDGFKEKHALADRAMKKLGLADAFKKTGLILPDGALTDPQIAKAFSAIGEAMFKEDTIDDDGGAQGGENPFKRGADGKIKSPGAISNLIKSDPDRAKRLAQEAGERWSDWAPSNPR
jgi:hypothetical protein